jgi:hypothetical protein
LYTYPKGEWKELTKLWEVVTQVILAKTSMSACVPLVIVMELFEAK